MEKYGYHGKILHVNLTKRSSWIEEPDEIFWRTYAGGGLLAAYYLYKETPQRNRRIAICRTGALHHRIQEPPDRRDR